MSFFVDLFVGVFGKITHDVYPGGYRIITSSRSSEDASAGSRGRGMEGQKVGTNPIVSMYGIFYLLICDKPTFRWTLMLNLATLPGLQLLVE